MGLRARARRFIRVSTTRLLALGVALLAGLVVYLIAVNVFPYHSVNDDEGVYLLQAAMLLEGQLFLYPGDLAPLVRPWFFVVDRAPSVPGDIRMYSKYGPVAPALFAVGKLVGSPRASLAVIATGNTVLVYGITAAAFDRRTGLAAAVVLVATPLFLLTSSVFLAYAPTTLFNLGFAYAYIRSGRLAAAGGRARGNPRDRVGTSLTHPRSVIWAGVAGCAIGIAFLSRPYTAVLFALPFVLHAGFVLVTTTAARVGSGSFRSGSGKDHTDSLSRSEDNQGMRIRGPWSRYLVIATIGLAFVGGRLGYNALLTGDPLVFPYQAFAPRDGIGFGERAILGYERRYTPRLAVVATERVLIELATDWMPAGLIGTVLTGVGLFRVRRVKPTTNVGQREVRALLGGVAVSVVVGNAYFWGTLNGLNNGLIDLLGPYYHFDLLLPIAAFTAAGSLATVSKARTIAKRVFTPSAARGVMLVLLLVAVPVGAGTGLVTVADPLEANMERTTVLETTYEPFEDRSFEDALVYTPDPYGDWQQHPFQYLRNDPGFDGPTLFVLDEGPSADWLAFDATNRTPYRFTYRGTWAGATEPVTPELTRLDVIRGTHLQARTVLGVPRGMRLSSIRLETRTAEIRYSSPNVTDGTLRVDWVLTPDTVRVLNYTAVGDREELQVPTGPSEVDLVVTFVGDTGGSITYRQEVTVDTGAGRIRAFWPPETRVCRLTTECGREGTWVGPKGDYIDGVSVDTAVRSRNATA